MITAFIVASVVAGIVIWFYESIRIPTMAGQIAFREDKIKSLENLILKGEERLKELESAFENKKIESAKWMASANQSADEFRRVSEKLLRANEQLVKVTQEFNTIKMDRQKEVVLKPVVNAHPAEGTANFEEAVVSVADKEDVAFLIIDKYVTELQLVSYVNFAQDFEDARTELNTSRSTDDVASHFASVFKKIIEYRDFILKLEKLRVHLMKKILEYYRLKLKKFEHQGSVAFRSDVRQQSKILTNFEELVKRLKSNENPNDWNENAIKVVDEFLSANSTLVNSNSKNDE